MRVCQNAASKCGAPCGSPDSCLHMHATWYTYQCCTCSTCMQGEHSPALSAISNPHHKHYMTCRAYSYRALHASLKAVHDGAADLAIATEAAAAAVAEADQASAEAEEGHRRQQSRQLQRNLSKRVSFAQSLVLRDCCFKWKKGQHVHWHSLCCLFCSDPEHTYCILYMYYTSMLCSMQSLPHQFLFETSFASPCMSHEYVFLHCCGQTGQDSVSHNMCLCNTESAAMLLHCT